jgi:hypothetical protein
MIEGSGSGSGSVPLTNGTGSGSRRPATYGSGSGSATLVTSLSLTEVRLPYRTLIIKIAAQQLPSPLMYLCPMIPYDYVTVPSLMKETNGRYMSNAKNNIFFWHLEAASAECSRAPSHQYCTPIINSPVTRKSSLLQNTAMMVITLRDPQKVISPAG